MNTDSFIFTNEVPYGNDKFVARISPNICDDNELLDALHYQCWFPAWDGRNWNALNDLLYLFEDIEEKEIYIVHKTLPNISEYGLKIYIEILYDTSIRALEHKKIFVIFPVHERENVLNILKETFENMENIDASSS